MYCKTLFIDVTHFGRASQNVMHVVAYYCMLKNPTTHGCNQGSELSCNLGLPPEMKIKLFARSMTTTNFCRRRSVHQEWKNAHPFINRP